MRILQKKTPNLLRVDSNFATLLDIEGEDTFVYEFQYFSATVNALRVGASIVRVSIRTELPLPEREIFGRIDDEGNNGKFIDDVVTFEAKRKDGRRSNRLSRVASKNSDITSNFNNEATTIVSRNEIPAEQVLGTIRVIDPQPLSKINSENVEPPILHVSNTSERVSRDTRAAALNLLDARVDPSSAGTRTSNVDGAFSSFSGHSSTTQTRNKQPLNTRSNTDNNIDSLVGSITQTGVRTTRSIDYSNETLIPRVVDVARTTIRNSTVIRISREKVGNSDFFAIFELLDSNGSVLEKLTERVPHNVLSRIFSIPREPPRIGIAPFQFHGRNVIDIEQRDPIGRKVRVYRRALQRAESSTMDSEYQLIAEIQLLNTDGLYKLVDPTNNSRINLYRVIAVGPGGLLGSEFSNAVAPAQLSNTADADRRSNAASISTKTIHEGIEITVNSVTPSCIAVAILRRDRTLHETEFNTIHVTRPVALVNKGLQAASFVDTEVKDNHIYEYVCKLYYQDGLETRSTAQALHKYIPVTTGVVTVSVDNLQVIRNGSILDVIFDVTSVVTEKNLDSVKRALQSQGLLDLFKDELKLERDKLQRLVAHNIQRVDIANGAVENFGTFTGTKFSDRKLGRERGVSQLRDNRNYRYKVTTLLRDAETMFDDLERTVARGVAGNSYTFKPAKFRHPFTLSSGTIVTRESLLRNHSEDDFSFGRIGETRDVDVILGTSAPKIKSVSTRRIDRHTTNVQWKLDGNIKQIEHFLVVKEQLGVKSIVGKVHHISPSNTFEFYDKLTPDDIGEIKYSVVPVLNDYSRTSSATSSPIVIRDGRI